MESVKINVSCHWIKNTYTPGLFSGGYEIKSCVGYPSINGGFGTGDFVKWTVKDIEDRVRDTYKDYACVKGKKLEITVTVVKDERFVQSLESFF